VKKFTKELIALGYPKEVYLTPINPNRVQNLWTLRQFL
jgi:hypothetical protein